MSFTNPNHVKLSIFSFEPLSTTMTGAIAKQLLDEGVLKAPWSGVLAGHETLSHFAALRCCQRSSLMAESGHVCRS